MESLDLALNSEKFDKAIHGGLDEYPVLPSGSDLAVYFKPNATKNGNGMAVITFTVQLPDGSFARAQYSTTVALIETLGRAVKGRREGGHL